MYENENNSFYQNESATQQENTSQQEQTTQQTGAQSDIRYTYNQNSTYSTNVNHTKKERRKGSGCFVAIIAALLCITIAALGINIYLVSSGKTVNTIFSSPAPSATADTPDSAFESVVQIAPTPTPQIVEGQVLTPTQVAQKVIPSVVCIQCYKSTDSYFGASSQESLFGEGSGIISRSDGYIITNAHVIDGASKVQVVLSNDIICDAEVIGSDAVTDLALLKIDPEGKNLVAATFTSASSSSVAEQVMAIGNPGGLEFSSSVTLGIISALNRAVQDSSTGYVMHCIQTDTAINPGNSGGPLVNMHGNVIGITSSKIVAEGYENMGFAITYDEAAPIIADLLAYGHVKNRATLNISLALPSSVFRITGWNTIPNGLCITKVNGEKETAAGLKQYDIISGIDEVKTTTLANYSSYLLSKKPGEKVTLTVYRANISGFSIQYSTTPIKIEIELSEAT